MFYGDRIIPWIEFVHIEHANEPVFVNVSTIVSIHKAASGVIVGLIGGGCVIVKGSTKQIRDQVDKFTRDWPDKIRALDEAEQQRRHAAEESKS